MKVRIKSVVNPAEVLRVEVEATGTLRDLQTAIQASGGPVDAQISLNKKTPLSHNSTDSLASLGICNGDLLWVLGANALTPAPAASVQGATSASAPAPPHHTVVQQEPQALASKKARQEATNVQPTCVQGPGTGAASGGVQAMDVDPGASSSQGRAASQVNLGAGTSGACGAPQAAGTEDMEEEEDDEEEEDVSIVKCPAPGHLRRLLAAQHLPNLSAAASLPPPSAAHAGAGGGGGKGGAAGAAPVQLPAAYSGPPAHQLLLLVLHAAMTEAGFQLSGAQEPSTAVAAGMDARAAAGQPSAPTLALVGPTRLTYTWANAGSGQVPPCSVQAVRMGRFLVLHASITQPAATASNANSAGPVDVVPPAVRTLHLDAVQEVDLEVAAAGGGKLSVGVFSAFKPLWLRLRDDVAQWAVAVVHTVAGLEVPLGLMTLPLEMKLAILAALPPKDLVSVSCTCTELHHLGYEDRLWCVHVNKEFPGALAAVRGPQGSMRALFVSKWMARKRAEEAHARRPHRMPGILPYPMPMPGGPPIPGMPFMPPGIIGGDYDRFPNLAAFGGTGGLGALGGLGGSMMMGGGGAGFSGPAFMGGRGGSGLMAPRQGGIHGPFGGAMGGRGGRSGHGSGGMFG